MGGTVGSGLSTLLTGHVIKHLGYIPVFTALGFTHLTAYALMSIGSRSQHVSCEPEVSEMSRKPVPMRADSYYPEPCSATTSPSRILLPPDNGLEPPDADLSMPFGHHSLRWFRPLHSWQHRRPEKRSLSRIRWVCLRWPRNYGDEICASFPVSNTSVKR